MSVRRIVPAVLAMGTAFPALGQQAPAPAAAPAPGPDIVVTGRGIPVDQADRSDAVIEIGRDRIVATASNRLEDVLADVAGLQSFRRADSRSANPTSQGLTLRGIGGNASSRALLILDGVPQADPFAGWVAFPAYAPAALGAVRVVRGGGSALWGPGALAGVVELESATPDQLPAAQAQIAYRSRDAVDALATATLKRDGGFATLTAGTARGDGFIPIVAGDRGPVDRAARYAQSNVTLRAAFDVGGDRELQATVRAFTDRRDRGLAFTDIASDGADASVRIVGRGAWRWSALGYIQSRRFASQFAAVSADRATVTPTLDQYNVPATGIGGRIELSPPLGSAIRLRIGADVRETRGTTRELFTFVGGAPTRRREAGGTTRTAGGFADLRVDADTLGIDLNGRVDGWWIANGRLSEVALAGGAPITDLAFADRDGVEPTGRAGLSWRPAGDVLTLRAAAYRGWRLPTPNELYRPFRVGADATAANATLRPERLDGVEAGFDLKPGAATFVSATLFDNQVRDAIANVTIARGPGNFPGVGFVSAAGFFRRRDNLAALDVRGIEIEAGGRVASVEARLSYAYTDARVQGAGTSAALDGLRPAQTPRHQASATLAWRAAAGTQASVTGRYQSSQFEDDQNSRVLGDALTLDSAATLIVGDGLALIARVENAFDARVDTGFSGNARERSHPRTLWLGVNATLR
ncbi:MULTISPECIES: TonB-dependent receptor [unclassified Sphingomonas]|uniref:TonB-dependent receptor n=1 Tax=unclassified Sphingomonas TaxID=196159 RepID=UPI00082F53D8|nr:MULTISPECIES: TonB-dependent receptor [unclassified Sphingomonas]